MKHFQRFSRLIILVTGFWLLAGFAEVVEVQMQSTEYPEPRFPAYLKPPKSIDDVMPYTRAIARNENAMQGAGMGVLKQGQSVLLVSTVDSEEMILEALKKALEERGITVHIRPNYELVGVSREDTLALWNATQNYTAEKGYMEGAHWVERTIPDADAAKQWLKERRPDLYLKVFPESQELSERLKTAREILGTNSVGQGIQAYLKKNPEIRGVYWGKGGGTGRRRALYPMSEKFLGILWADNRWEVMSKIGSYPADVWQLTEEKTLEPLAYVDNVRVTDPEGTDLSTDISEVQAEKWARGSYQRGHLYMFPNQATGRFGYSVIDYPAFQNEWLPREPIAKPHGVIAGTNGHGGFFPRWEVHFKDGYITEVRGGGLYGDLLREFLHYPGTQELTYPFHDNPGFWYLYECAFGTHPKYFRNPKYMMTGSLGPERLRSGVIHWGLGIRVWHDPDEPLESIAWQKFTIEHNVPKDHNFHTHTYFTTYQVRIRGADRWVTLLDKGRMSSLDDPEVRALASRYGNPDTLLAEEWIPEIPGINAPGDYLQGYAANPWNKSKEVIDSVLDGTYEYFYPKIETSRK